MFWRWVNLSFPFSNLLLFSPNSFFRFTHLQLSPGCRFHLLGYAIRYAPIPRSGTVSWVLCGQLGVHHPRSPAIEGYSTPKNLSCVMISVVCDRLHVIFTLGFLSPQKSIFTKRLLHQKIGQTGGFILRRGRTKSGDIYRLKKQRHLPPISTRVLIHAKTPTQIHPLDFTTYAFSPTNFHPPIFTHLLSPTQQRRMRCEIKFWYENMRPTHNHIDQHMHSLTYIRNVQGWASLVHVQGNFLDFRNFPPGHGQFH